jgi:hypothetical protein
MSTTLFGLAFVGVFQLNVAKTLKDFGDCQGGKHIYDAAKASAIQANQMEPLQSFSGELLATVEGLIPGGGANQAHFDSGMVAAFIGPYHGGWKSWGIYGSATGRDLGGGGTTTRLAYEAGVQKMTAWRGDLFVVTTFGVVRTHTGDLYGATRVYP